jgi:hypothetical protein
MDKPITPAGPKDSASSFLDDLLSDNGGATGIFGSVTSPDPASPTAPRATSEPERPLSWNAEPTTPLPPQKPSSLAEPVVHKVVFGGGSAENSAEILDRMRFASSERPPVPEKPSSAESANWPPAAADPSNIGRNVGGFTQLLQTLGTDPAPPAPAPPATASQAPPAPTPSPAQNSGFTSLLQSLGTPASPATSAPDLFKPVPPVSHFTPDPFKPAQAASPFFPEPPKPAPASSGSGGFTELLRAAPLTGPGFAGPQSSFPGLGAAPVTARPASEPMPPPKNEPGSFTQLFGTFGGASAGQVPLVSSPRETPPPPAAAPGSFTSMMSIDPQSLPPAPPFQARPMTAGPDLTMDRGRPAETGRDPFSATSMAEAQPAPGTPPATGGGITRLIRMLDEPAVAPAPRVEASAPPPPLAGAGVWTQTFASLSETAAPPQAGFPPPRDAGFPGAMTEPAMAAPPPPSSSSGPSEFTRILDASKLREMAMRGGQAPSAAAPAPAAAPQNVAPPPPQFQMPNYPVPGMPAAPGMPQAGAFPPPQPGQIPGYPPMNYGAHPGAAPGMLGTTPQMPGMYAPVPPPMPVVPPIPAVKPPEPAAGKLQQFIPLLLVLIIVMLVVLLVTVIFLLKH